MLYLLGFQKRMKWISKSSGAVGGLVRRVRCTLKILFFFQYSFCGAFHFESAVRQSEQRNDIHLHRVLFFNVYVQQQFQFLGLPRNSLKTLPQLAPPALYKLQAGACSSSFTLCQPSHPAPQENLVPLQ